jgi:hypothetical protein
LSRGGPGLELIPLIMTDRGVASLMASNVKLEANLSVAAGPVGGGMAAEFLHRFISRESPGCGSSSPGLETESLRTKSNRQMETATNFS